MAKPKYKEGDIIKNKWGDLRLIMGTVCNHYIYIEKRKDKDWYYNTYSSFVTINHFDRKDWQKVSEFQIPDKSKLYDLAIEIDLLLIQINQKIADYLNQHISNV